MFMAKLAVLSNTMQIKFTAAMNKHVKRSPGIGVLWSIRIIEIKTH